VSEPHTVLRKSETSLPDSHEALEQQVQERTAALRESEAALRDSEVWLAAQKEAFQAAVNDAPLEVSLDILVRTAVKQSGTHTRCAFYIADAQGAELHHVTGMAKSYAECVDGFKIGPDSLACGLAVYTGQPVITVDVTQESRWQPWLWLAERYQFRGCWSFPIETTTGRVVGTFAIYFESPRGATPRDHAMAGVLTRTAAIIISRHQEVEERGRAVEALRESEAALRRALPEREACTNLTRWRRSISPAGAYRRLRTSPSHVSADFERAIEYACRGI
jgi:GAF domain-containing protein